MSRPTFLERLIGQRQPVSSQHAHRRRMFFESLEERRVLACTLDATGGQAGGLDPDFGVSGWATFQSAQELANDVVVDSAGRTIVVGEYVMGLEDIEFLVARFNLDGSLDTNFSNNDGDGFDGVKLIDFDGGNDAAFGVALDSSGNIIVAGTSNQGSQNDIAIARLLPSGDFDLAFNFENTPGKLLWQQASTSDSVEDVAVQGDGSIVVVGSLFYLSGEFIFSYDSHVSRFTAGGALDTTFSGINDPINDGIDGVKIIGFGLEGSIESAVGVAIQTDGRIVVAANVEDAAVRVARLTSTGEMELTYGQDGFLAASDLALLTDGSVFVVGTVLEPGVLKLAVAGFDSSGVNLNLGPGNFARIGVAGSDVLGTDIVYDSNTGKLVVVGNAVQRVNDIPEPTGQFLVARLGTDGVLDTTFGTGGVTVADLSSSSGIGLNDGKERAEAVAIDPFSGKIVVAGKQVVTGGTNDVVVARFLSAGSGPSEKVLTINGTSAADTIRVSPVDGGVEAFLNSVSLGVFVGENAPCKIVVNAGGGDDDVQIAGSISLSAWLYGGAGNDRLKGGSGHDILLGEDGDDLLVGGSGRDILIGGTGADRIVGNTDDDIIISGTTMHDESAAALCAILDEWTSSRDADTRKDNISGLGTVDRLNGDYFLRSSTVFDDGARDVMTGSSGFDWFFADLGSESDQTKDKITDLSAVEFANDLAFIET